MLECGRPTIRTLHGPVRLATPTCATFSRPWRALPPIVRPTRRAPRATRIRRLHHASHSESRLLPGLAPLAPSTCCDHCWGPCLALGLASPSASLRGIELRAGIELRVDEPFATVCFTRLRCMFHVFNLYVSRVLSECCKRIWCCICCNSYIRMFQVYIPHVSAVSDICCKCMFKIF
jgi:hypothetical protein